MAFDPNAPLFPAYWDDSFEAQYQAALGGGMPDQQQIALPGELSKTDVPQTPPPPPPPPPHIAAPGVPVVDEVPMGQVDPPLTPEEEAQIQIDQPQLAADGTTPFGDPVEMTPPLQADAISGQPETQGDTPHIAYSEPAPDEYATPEQLGTRLADRSAEEQLAYQQQHAEAQDNFSRARVLEESRKQLDLQTKHTEALIAAQQAAQQKRQEIDAQATEIANTSPLDTISTGRKIAGVAAAIIGGFAMNRTGRNVGLEAVGQMIDEAAAEQATKLQNLAGQRRGINENLATAGDSFQTQEALRLGMWDHFIRNLETEVQNYDPRGTTAIRTMNAINQARAQRAALADKAEKETFERMKAVIDMQSKVAATNKTIAETNKLKGAGVGGAKPPKFEDVPRSLAELRALGVAIPSGVAEPPGGISLTQAKKLADSGKSAEEWTKASRENSPDELNRQQAVGEVFDDKGEPVRFREPGKIADMLASVDTVSQYADEMIDLYAKHGFEPDFLKSEAWRQAQGAFASAVLESKNADQLGALSGSDIDLEVKKITGGVDVTGVRDPRSAIQSFKRRLEVKVNSAIRHQAVPKPGHRVLPWKAPNTAASTMPTAKADYIDELGAELKTALYKRTPDETGNPLADANNKIAGAIYKPLNDDVDRKLDILISTASVRNDNGDRALEHLRGIAANSVYPEMKAKAEAALDQIPGGRGIQRER